MKKHTLYLTIIIFFLMFIFLCYSDSPLNAESPRLDRGIIAPPLKDLANKNNTHLIKNENTFNSPIKENLKLYSSINPTLIPIPDQKSILKMPEMIVRNNIDYKILKMRVNTEVDYKILDLFPKSKYIGPGILLNN